MDDWLSDRERWRRQLMLGLSPEQTDLDALALLSARSRYDEVRPGELGTFPARPTTVDLIEGRARQHLLRLFGKRRPYELPDTASLRVLDALADARLSLHPFDYPALTRLMHADPVRLDRGASQWLARAQASPQDSQDAAPSALDDESWWSATPTVRVAYLRSLRREAPQRARELLQQACERDTAANRSKLLATVSYGLGSDDQALLEQVYAEDRAQSVRAVAERLLARLPGTNAYRQRTEEAASAMKVQRGLTGIKVVVQVPKAFKGKRRAEWLVETFDGADPLGLATHLDLAPIVRDSSNSRRSIRRRAKRTRRRS
ncbi:MAG: DUF5691 domain-containing protein [Pseudomonadota bacterium]